MHWGALGLLALSVVVAAGAQKQARADDWTSQTANDHLTGKKRPVRLSEQSSRSEGASAPDNHGRTAQTTRPP